MPIISHRSDWGALGVGAMLRKITGWIGVAVLAFGFIDLLGGFFRVGPVAQFIIDLFNLTFVDSLMFFFQNVLSLRLSQQDTIDILLGLALAGVVYSAIRIRGGPLPKRGFMLIPLAVYAAVICLGTLFFHFMANEITELYAKECIQETTAGWSLRQYWELFSVSNWPIDHCRIHERQLYAPPPPGLLKHVEFFVQYLGSTLILFVLPVALLISFFLRRLEVNQILIKNASAAFSAFAVVFGLGQFDWRQNDRQSSGDFAYDYATGESFRDCAECPLLVAVPGGPFTMGSPLGEAIQLENRQLDTKGRRRDDEWPQREVVIDPFAAGKFEVTWDEWGQCVAAGGCDDFTKNENDGATLEDHQTSIREAMSWGLGSRPVVGVTWDDAQAYATWLSAKSGKSYRLLSEAEWEYAARAGSPDRFSFDETSQSVCRHANFADRSYWQDKCAKPDHQCGEDVLSVCDDGFTSTAPIGSFIPNAFGLYDVHGNVSEWVEDCYRIRYFGAPDDGSSISTGDCGRRVVRGGGMDNHAPWIRSAARQWAYPDNRSIMRGFRVARAIKREN